MLENQKITVFLAVIAISFTVAAGIESDFFDSPEVTVQLSHAFGKNEDTYLPRGSVTIRNFKGPKYGTEQKDLSTDDLATLKTVAEEDGYYFLKATIKTPSGEQSFKTFSPVRSLLNSGLSDVLNVHLSPNGDIVAVGYSMGRSDFFSHPMGASRPVPLKFNTAVTVHHGEPGPVPDTAPYLEKLEMERIAKERGDDPRDNRTFLGKYWMYIVPIFLLVLLSGASNPEGEGGR